MSTNQRSWRIATIAGGAGRSGSTLLGEALSASPDVIFIGELRQLAKHWNAANLCSCGTPLPECEFWQPIVAAVLQRQGLAAGAGVPSGFPEDEALISAVLDEIQLASGAKLILDSSKRPDFIDQLVGLDASIVHLLRDSRAVAASWRRQKAKQYAGSTEMRRYGPLKSSYLWITRNLAQEWRRKNASGYVRIRYEDMCSNPAEVFDDVYQALDLGAVPDALQAGRVDSIVSHHVAGNPRSHRRDSITLRLDDTWRDELSTPDRLAVSALTFPVMLRYGYGPRLHRRPEKST